MLNEMIKLENLKAKLAMAKTPIDRIRITQEIDKQRMKMASYSYSATQKAFEAYKEGVKKNG